MISARLIDPRDITYEVEQPTYRVTFWSQPPLPLGVPSSKPGSASSEGDVQGADLDECWTGPATLRVGPAPRIG